jgi:hypothetical protein
LRFAIITALALGATTAQAAEVKNEHFEATNVASVVKLCSADQATEAGKYAIGFCYGWIEGLEQFYAALLRDERFDVQPAVCPGRVVSREETRQIFLDWAAANPGMGNLDPLEGLIRASKEKFPCT